MKWLARNVLYLSREDWGANQSYPRLGGPAIPRGRRYYSIVHHTVGVDNDTTKNTWENLDEIKAMMKRLQLIRPDLGADVPYSFVVFAAILDGQYVLVLCEGRGYEFAGAHTAGADAQGAYFNVVGIALSWAGDFENHPFDYDPWRSANKTVYRHLRNEFPNLGTKTVVAGKVTGGHKDFAPYSSLNQTACCGQNLYKHLPDFTFDTLTPEEEDEVLSQAKLNVGGLFFGLSSDVIQGFPLNKAWCDSILALIGDGPTAPVTVRQHAHGLLTYAAGEAMKGIVLNPQATKEVRFLCKTRPAFAA